MSLVLQRMASTSSSGLQRDRASKPNHNIVNTSGSTYSSSRMAKQGRNTISRPLPDGPGPLPNKANVVYITGTGSSSRDRQRPLQLHGNTDLRNPKSSLIIDSPITRRKTSNDHGNSHERRVSDFRYGNFSSNTRNKSKSLPHLNVKDETKDKLVSPISPLKSRTDASASEKRGYLHSQSSLERDHLNYKHNNIATNSIYRPTTHLDCKDPWEHKPSQAKMGHSYISDKGLYNGSAGKSGYSVVDAEKTRKVTITALPRSDLKSAQKSSLSSSNSSPSPTGRGSSDGLVGLRNLGNTCFMNSILQCLSHTPSLTEQLLKSQHLKGKLIQAFVDLIKSMWKPGNTDAVSPHTFKTQIQRFAPRFMGYSQQDAQEFLRFLLEGLHDDLNEVKSKPKYRQCEFPDSLSELQIGEKSWERYLLQDKSLMTDLFVGQLKSKLVFSSCDHKSVTFDPFWDLSIPIPRKTSTSSLSSIGRRYSGVDDGDIGIRDCMLSFTREEVLDGDEQPTCDKCKTKRKATKKFSIQRFPRILVLHLKRFSGFSYRSKLQSNVDFPFSLDLTEFSSDPEKIQPVTYSLYAVSNHSGSTYGGHYTAYCKHPISKDWHCFNDSRVDPISSSRVRGNQAYILFYKRVDRKSSL